MTMTSTGKETGRPRHQRTAHRAWEHCRNKRAKCDGQKPCGRCKSYGYECNFIMRGWASKQSLQQEIITLREELSQRDRVIEALRASGCCANFARMLEEGGTTVGYVSEKLRGSSIVTPPSDSGSGEDTAAYQMSDASCECQNSWSQSSTSTNSILDRVQGHIPLPFIWDRGPIGDLPRASIGAQTTTITGQHGLSESMQSIPWAGLGATSFDGMPGKMTLMQLNVDPGPNIIDPSSWAAYPGLRSPGITDHEQLDWLDGLYV